MRVSWNPETRMVYLGRRSFVGDSVAASHCLWCACNRWKHQHIADVAVGACDTLRRLHIEYQRGHSRVATECAGDCDCPVELRREWTGKMEVSGLVPAFAAKFDTMKLDVFVTDKA